MLYEELVEVVGPVVFMIALGYLFQRWRRLDIAPVVDVTFYVASPLLVFSSLASRSLSAQLYLVVVAAATVIAVSAAVSYAAFRGLGAREVAARVLPVAFMNSGNMGIPVCALAFGPLGLASASLYFVTTNILTNTLGILIAAGEARSLRGAAAQVLRLPHVYAALLGVSVSTFSLTVPTPIATAADLVGQAAIPMLLISLGAKLADPGGRGQTRPALASSAMRIGLGFLLGYGSAILLGLEGPVRGTVVVESSMPSAVMSFILSQKYGEGSALVAQTVIVSTLLSFATTPLILAAL